VVELSPPSERGTVPARLAALVRRELLRPAPARLPGDQGFQFRHLLLRDAPTTPSPSRPGPTCTTCSPSEGERTAGPRLREIEEIIGYHLEQAWRYRGELGFADERNQRLATAAARHLGAAGRRALGRGDLPAASKLLERAVSLLPAGDPGGLELFVELADVLVATGEFARAEAVLAQVTAAATDRGDERVAAHAQVARMRMAVGVAADLDADAIQRQTRQAIATSPSSRTSAAWPRPGGCWPPSGSCAAASPRPGRPPGRPSPTRARPATTPRSPGPGGCSPRAPSGARPRPPRASAAARTCSPRPTATAARS
jgi:hypothetical protein